MSPHNAQTSDPDRGSVPAASRALVSLTGQSATNKDCFQIFLLLSLTVGHGPSIFFTSVVAASEPVKWNGTGCGASRRSAGDLAPGLCDQHLDRQWPLRGLVL